MYPVTKNTGIKVSGEEYEEEIAMESLQLRPWLPKIWMLSSWTLARVSLNMFN